MATNSPKILLLTLFKWGTWALLTITSFVVVYPLLLLYLTPVFLYREIVTFTLKQSNPKIRRVLSGMDAALAGPNTISKPMMTLAPYLIFSENLDRNHIIKLLHEKWIQCKDYPELKQRLVQKFGYYFWEDVENFSIENHVTYLYPDMPDKPVRRNDLRGVEAEKVVYKPFNPRYSPWELILVPNVFDEENPEVRSAVYFRYNHCMMDGQSGLKLLSKTGLKPWVSPKPKSLARESVAEGIKTKLSMMFQIFKIFTTAPYHIVQLTLSNDKSEFLQKALSWLQRNPQEIAMRKEVEPTRFEMNKLKLITQKFQVGMSSLITAIVLSGMAKYIRKRCADGFSETPKKFVVQLVTPLPGHPNNKITNYWSVLRLPIKMQDAKDPVAMLKSVHDSFTTLGVSVVPLVNFLVFKIFGLLPIGLQPSGQNKLCQMLMLSNFPGPRNRVDFCGLNVVHWTLMATSPSISGFSISPQNLGDKIWIEHTAPKVLLRNQEDVLEMEKFFSGIIDTLAGHKLDQYESKKVL